MTAFDKATTVRAGASGFEADLDPTWTISDNPHGGYLLAVLARAAIETDREANHPHPLAASAVYLSPARVGPASVAVEVLRRGRTASQLRAKLVQDGETRVEALFTLGRLPQGSTAAWVDAPPPDVAPPEQCPRSPVRPPGVEVRVAMLDIVEQRLDLKSLGDRERDESYPLRGGSGEVRGWLKFADGTPFDPVSLLYAADAFPPATLTLGSVGWVPTMELTVYVRSIPAPGRLRVRQRVRMLAGSLVDQVCEIWDSGGRVVAQASQLASVRMGPTEKTGAHPH